MQMFRNEAHMEGRRCAPRAAQAVGRFSADGGGQWYEEKSQSVDAADAGRRQAGCLRTRCATVQHSRAMTLPKRGLGGRGNIAQLLTKPVHSAAFAQIRASCRKSRKLITARNYRRYLIGIRETAYRVRIPVCLGCRSTDEGLKEALPTKAGL